MARILVLITASLFVLQSFQAEQVNKSTLRTAFLRAVSTCAMQYTPTTGIGMTFFTRPNSTDKASKCFATCLLREFELVENDGTFRVDSLQKFLKSIPQSRFKESLQRNAQSCLKVDDPDPCEKGYMFIRCFYTRSSRA